MLKNLLVVGIGGASGSIFRYLISIVSYKNTTHSFPWSTFTANMVGCFLIGLFFGFFERHFISYPELKLLLITGFCGGLTTFSTFSAEGYDLIQAGHYTTAIIYIACSIMAGLLILLGGLYLIKIFTA